MPVYRQLADGPRSGLAPCGISPDGKTWVVLVSSFVQTYDIASDTWGEIMPMQHVSLGPLTGAVDPDSGNLYVPFAVYGTGEQMYMLILNTKSPKSYYGEFNSSAPISDTDRTGYTVAWSRAMKGFVYVGGTEIYSYSPSTGWTDLRPLTSGQAPSGSRHYSCVVAAGDSKVIVFGGQSNITRRGNKECQ
ncbi:hypothetical protein BGX31_003930 [Mortierella sp. GBA43]|nr:hypothetical protein BGX31_003930 [Mortierella sp. GBA43]